jgi:hypothetical protein
MKLTKILFLIAFPFVVFSQQIPVYPGPANLHVIDSVSIDYSTNPTRIFAREINGKFLPIRKLQLEVVSPDTVALNLFFIDCMAYFLGQKVNDTIVEVPQSLSSTFNLIVRTYLDTNRVTAVPETCYLRTFYTRLDSVFISSGNTIYYQTMSTDEEFENEKWALYPNPVVNILKWSGTLPKNANYEIYSLQGVKVLSGLLEHEIDVRKLNGGTYMIHVTSPQHIFTKRFVKR